MNRFDQATTAVALNWITTGVIICCEVLATLPFGRLLDGCCLIGGFMRVDGCRSTFHHGKIALGEPQHYLPLTEMVDFLLLAGVISCFLALVLWRSLSHVIGSCASGKRPSLSSRIVMRVPCCAFIC